MNGQIGLPVHEPVALESNGVSECAKAAAVLKVKCSSVALQSVTLQALQQPWRRSLNFSSGRTGLPATGHAAQVSECE